MRFNMTVSALAILGLVACGDDLEAQAPAAVEDVEQGGGQASGFSEADEAFYAARFERFLKRMKSGGMGVDYDTLGEVDGAETYQALSRKTPSLLSPETLDAATAYAAENNSSAFLVYRNGAVISETYFGDTDSGSLLNSKSLAKPLGVIAVGRAIAKGAIKSLDQSVADFITEWKGKPQEKILVRHLLEMRSGLLPQRVATTAEDIINRAYLHPRHDEVIINEYPMTHEVEERYEYSNANSELVAPLIERATGVEYEDWIAAEVLAPIGAMGGTIWLNREDGTAHSGCCVQLPAETWLRLAILVMQGGAWDGDQILSQNFIDAMLTSTPQNKFAGMGVFLGRDFIEYRGVFAPDSNVNLRFHSAPYLADDLFMFDGNSNQIIYMVPSQDLVIVRLGDNPSKDPPWDNAYLPNLILGDVLGSAVETDE